VLLAVDVGNTDIKLGVFDGDLLCGTWRWATDRSRMPDEYAAQLGWVLQYNEIPFEAIDRSVLCSVVPAVTSTFQDLIKRYLDTDPLVVHAGIETGIKLAVDNPREVGGDRIANAVAALRLYGAPAVVVDLGTATNFDVVSPEGTFLGGSFAPGLTTGIDGLLAHAARLQRFDLVRPSRAIGTNTIACLQSGAIFGHVGMVEYLLSRISAELGAPPLVIGTGGLVEIIAAETNAFAVIDRDLTLKGLRILKDLNEGA
jgi:type III pantothenate kinase